MALCYTNPVWPEYFADPFVLSWQGEYFAYGTGESVLCPAERDASVFDVLRSNDLVHWKKIGRALIPPTQDPRVVFWAPEVGARDGRFFLYYSTAPAGHDELHRLRVAIADHPGGPFSDAGAVLPETEGFCIDAHPFRDPRDGQWYLFFAKDYFENRAGTGLAVAPLRDDMLRASEKSRAILQANADWQIYERGRSLYGRTWAAWHTVEGPCVVMHDARYYCFYSGGNWQTHEYGISFAVADHPLGPWRHPPGEGPVVLRQHPPEVVGPGHNSYAIAPDGRTELLVYHAWDAQRTARRMYLDRLDWTEHGPRCIGPTTTPQPL